MSHTDELHSDLPPKPTKKQCRHARSGHRYISLVGLSTCVKLAVLLTSFAVLSISAISAIGMTQFSRTFNDLDVPFTNQLERQLAVGVSIAALTMLVTYVVSIVLVCIFMYRANANLRRMGVSGLEFTPAWCGGWWFVPFANLVKPYQAMVELQRYSEQPGGGSWKTMPALHWWWGCWLFGAVTIRLSSRLEGHVSNKMMIGTDLAGASLMAIAGILLIVIVGRIANAQTQYHDKLTRHKN